jgi:hypothetical protein
MDQHETAASDPGVLTVHHAKRQRGGHGGIDGITALFERLQTGLGCQGMDRRRHAAGFGGFRASSRAEREKA